MGSARVLLVESDEALAELLTYVLNRVGVAVDAFDTFARAKEHLVNRHPPNLVLADLYLHREEEGCTFLRELGESWGFTIPVVLLTGVAELPEGLGALGASNILIKPFALDALLDVLRDHLPVVEGGVETLLSRT